MTKTSTFLTAAILMVQNTSTATLDIETMQQVVQLLMSDYSAPPHRAEALSDDVCLMRVCLSV